MTFIWFRVAIRVMMVMGGAYALFHLLMTVVGANLIGSKTLSLSLSELEKLRCDIEGAVSDYVNGYVEGNGDSFPLSLYRLNEAFGEVICDDFLMEYMEHQVEIDERVDSFQVIEGQLVLEVNAMVLKERYAKKVLEWECEGQWDRIDYYSRLERSQGVRKP